MEDTVINQVTLVLHMNRSSEGAGTELEKGAEKDKKSEMEIRKKLLLKLLVDEPDLTQFDIMDKIICQGNKFKRRLEH